MIESVFWFLMIVACILLIVYGLWGFLTTEAPQEKPKRGNIWTIQDDDGYQGLDFPYDPIAGDKYTDYEKQIWIFKEDNCWYIIGDSDKQLELVFNSDEGASKIP